MNETNINVWSVLLSWDIFHQTCDMKLDPWVLKKMQNLRCSCSYLEGHWVLPWTLGCIFKIHKIPKEKQSNVFIGPPQLPHPQSILYNSCFVSQPEQKQWCFYDNMKQQSKLPGLIDMMVGPGLKLEASGAIKTQPWIYQTGRLWTICTFCLFEEHLGIFLK